MRYALLDARKQIERRQPPLRDSKFTRALQRVADLAGIFPGKLERIGGDFEYPVDFPVGRSSAAHQFVNVNVADRAVTAAAGHRPTQLQFGVARPLAFPEPQEGIGDIELKAGRGH